MRLHHLPEQFFSNAFRPYFAGAEQRRDQDCLPCDKGNVSTSAPAQPVQPPVAETPATEDSSLGTPQSKIAVAGAEVSQTRSASVKIKTREGDEVTIDLSQSFVATALRGTASGPGGEVSAQSYSLYADTALSYSVSGDINDEEQAAIDGLLKDVDKLARQFYRGNINAAFKRATNLGFDADMLASVAVNLTQTRTVSAIAAYQQNSVPAPAPVIANPVITPSADVAPTPKPVAAAPAPAIAPTAHASTAPAAAPANDATSPPAATPSTGGTIPDLVKFLRDLYQLLNDEGANKLLDDSMKTVATLVEKATALKVDLVANAATGVNADGQNVLKTLIESAAKAEPAKEVTPDGTAVAA